jgi:fructoselysine-6-P-deglycase FrlB-like protein
MSRTAEEIASQPAMWAEALGRLPSLSRVLPRPGESLAAVGCGTSLFVAAAYARAREDRGGGLTVAEAASEFAVRRPYDRVLAISRSGTTTEVVRLLEALPAGLPSVAISAVGDSPVARAASEAIVLDFADEESVVQTRFATSALLLLRAHLGEDLARAIEDADDAVDRSLPADPREFDQFVFLGTGWTVGVADEAALKMREVALAWSESYPAMEYRHGPISIATPRTLVWHMGGPDPELDEDIRATGATLRMGTLDPLAELILVQRTALELSRSRGLDPDHPRHLTRSVVLS